ncbi:UDP-N-acetylmuramate--L-alanine ligase [uncultured Rikenella sp.]|uniref:UDP-N-acetylmuramate--L-alanine ligase n=1 Tax=uncultured Rikenella sp. TaxID=368003 RepID=UPI002607EBD5|nr:UDP-N-acetylmuramate--L-alanine ligase [uncultured Rikenella sp.]
MANEKKDKVYFVGIGGIGMSALARYFAHEGWQVAGYDRTPSPLTEALEREGIAVHYEDSVEAIPAAFHSPADTRVIYTPAVPPDHSELRWFRANGFEVLKRSRMLGLLGEGKDVMAVAGTHGKTTTTTMAAHFNAVGAGEGSAFLGGISKNFGSNLVLGKGRRMAVEADEFDRSFLQLHPREAVITSVDPDHLDIYGTYEAVREAFAQFASQIVPGGTLILKYGVSLPLERTDIRRYTYHVSDPAADFHAENLRVDAGGYYAFDLVFPDRRIDGCRLGIPGLVNVENCVAAAALVWCEGFLSDDGLREAIATFRGVLRRFDFWVNDPERPGGTIYMDDYAHHPAELRAMLTSVRKMFPARELTVVFQPHLYTRTRDFAGEFSEVLSLADRVLLLPIYPARELPIPGVASEMIWDGIGSPQKKLISKERLLPEIEALPEGGVLVTAGAGDIDRFCAPIAELVRRKNG